MSAVFPVDWGCRGLAVLCITLVLITQGWAQPGAAAVKEDIAEIVKQAQVLIDEHKGYGDRLRRAEDLIRKALQIDPGYARTYVQAARLTIVSGRIVSLEFRGGTLESAEALLKKSIVLDPDEADAYVVLGHVNNLMGNHEQAFENLSKAQELRATNPWLLNNFGAYYEGRKDLDKAGEYYRRMVGMGAGDTPQQRNAFIDAAVKLQWFAALRDDNKSVFEFGKLATAAASPTDAWTWGNVGNILFIQGYFDEAETHARKALSIMDYPVGREVLSHALYGKWVIALVAGHTDEGEKFFAEAYRLNPDLREVISRFGSSARKLMIFVPVLVKRSNELGMERADRMTEVREKRMALWRSVFAEQLPYPGLLVYNFVECLAAFAMVWLATRKRYGVAALHGGVVLLGGWLLGSAVLLLAIGTPLSRGGPLMGTPVLESAVGFLVFGATMWLLLMVYGKRISGIAASGSSAFRDVGPYAAWWVVIGAMTYATAPADSRSIQEFLAVNGERATIGALFGLVCGVIFTLCQNLLNPTRKAYLRWLFAILLWGGLVYGLSFMPDPGAIF